MGILEITAFALPPVVACGAPSVVQVHYTHTRQRPLEGRAVACDDVGAHDTPGQHQQRAHAAHDDPPLAVLLECCGCTDVLLDETQIRKRGMSASANGGTFT